MIIKKIVSAAIGVAVVFSPSAVLADGHMEAGPSWGAVEINQCAFKPGKTMADLQAVNAKWNAWADKNLPAQYSAWVYTPIYFNTSIPANSVFWFGAVPSSQILGKGGDAWISSGGPILAQYMSVLDCSNNSLMTSTIVRPAAANAPASVAPIVTFTDCTLKENKTVDDYMSAQKSFNKFLDSKKIVSVVAAHLRGPGTALDATWNMKLSTWYPNMTEYGRLRDVSSNEGGRQAYEEAFENVMTCNASRVYSAKLVRAAKM